MQSCAIYLSTGVASVASQVAACAARSTRVVVVDTFTDSSYARSSIKLVGAPADLLDAVREASIHALSLIDLSRQPLPAHHPRCGAVDLISFMPLSEKQEGDIDVDMKVCQCFPSTTLC